MQHDGTLSSRDPRHAVRAAKYRAVPREAAQVKLFLLGTYKSRRRDSSSGTPKQRVCRVDNIDGLQHRYQ